MSGFFGQYFWFFLAIAAALAVQIYFTGVQSKAFMAAIRQLRSKGRVSVGVGGRRYIGRRAYIGIAVDENNRVVDALVLRGVTQLARPRPAPRLVGLTVAKLAGKASLPGVDAIERAAARQAAELMSASGGWQPTGGAEKGKESVRRA